MPWKGDGKELYEARLLAGTVGLTMRHLRSLRRYLGAEEALMDAGEPGLRSAGLGPAQSECLAREAGNKAHLHVEQEIERMGASILVYGFPGYPEALEEIPDAPPALFLRGRLPGDDRPMLAMIGSRRCTPEGRLLAKRLGKALAHQGVCVVSGMARGIDAEALKGCMTGGGFGIGVLGCGIDQVYPPENSRLYMETGDQGAILTEFPPGTQPRRMNFPRRNRIISGLARGVLVVEASERSGSLITANHALDQGRTVMAVPGPVGLPFFRGSNALIRDGASVILDAQDVMAALFLPYRAPGPAGQGPLRGSDPLTDRILDLMAHQAWTLEAISASTGMASREVMERVSRLELDGRVERVPGARFIRTLRDTEQGNKEPRRKGHLPP